MKEGYDVSVIADMFVDRDLHLELSRGDFAMARRIFFVDEFDGEDGVIFCEGACFFDAIDMTWLKLVILL